MYFNKCHLVYEDDDDELGDQSWDGWASRMRSEYEEKATRVRRCRAEAVEAERRRRRRPDVETAPPTVGTYTPRIRDRPLLPVEASRELYAANCGVVFNSTGDENSNGGRQLKFDDIPWPAGGSLDSARLRKFFCCGEVCEAVKSLKRERIRWHPDRFKQRTAGRLCPDDELKVLDHVNALSQTINSLIDALS